MRMIAITPWRRTLATWVHPQSDLYTLNPNYVEGVENAGAYASIVPHVTTEDEACDILQRFDGLIISGGADMDPSFYGQENTASNGPDPASDTSDLAFVHAARQLGRPLLAICRGAQVLNVAFGGTLHQNVWSAEGDHPPKPDSGDAVADSDAFLSVRHDVDLTPDSLAAQVFGATRISTNSLHHQAVDQPGKGLIVTGRAADGVAEVLEHESRRMLGVQWHPERLIDEGHQALFDWLVEESG